ncbi:hypothetical protein PoB_005813800 [Plakobranchus ocellatus]|uniref:Uncharacterized protein n=1 Tax=Plakobranchus ocellatus TaxID=259542 RepID=A0AAV4CKM2_9GAST|nr:hypothetical protein PoB_005813800 [Plakobranchus ocellatus]
MLLILGIIHRRRGGKAGGSRGNSDTDSVKGKARSYIIMGVNRSVSDCCTGSPSLRGQKLTHGGRALAYHAKRNGFNPQSVCTDCCFPLSTVHALKTRRHNSGSYRRKHHQTHSSENADRQSGLSTPGPKRSPRNFYFLLV